MYEQWHECYEAGWHLRLLKLLEVESGRDDAHCAPLAMVVAVLAGDRALAEFARFHNSQLVPPIPRLEHALLMLAQRNMSCSDAADSSAQ